MLIMLIVAVGIVAMALFSLAAFRILRAYDEITASRPDYTIPRQPVRPACEPATRSRSHPTRRAIAPSPVALRLRRPSSRYAAITTPPCAARRRLSAGPPARTAMTTRRARRRSSVCSRRTSTRRRSRGA